MTTDRLFGSPKPGRAPRIARWAGGWVAFALLGAVPAQGQQLKGTVRDSETRAAVRGAFVTVLDSTASIVAGIAADNRGRFRIAVPEPGVYAIATSGNGYITQLSGWIQVSASDSLEVTVRLARAVNTLSPIVVEAQRDSIRDVGVPGVSQRIVAGTIVTPAEVALAARTAVSPYDLLQTLNVASLEVKTVVVDASGPGQRGMHGGMYRCIAYRRTGGCVTIVVNGQRYSDVSDLLQLEGLLSASDISHLIFLRPSEAGTLYGEETTNGVLIVVRKNEH